VYMRASLSDEVWLAIGVSGHINEYDTSEGILAVTFPTQFLHG
jgi:hypothetical protein